MSLKFKPYVGITGFTRRKQIETLLSEINPDLFGDRQLMVGVLVNARELTEPLIKRPGHYVSPYGIGQVFIKDERCLNIVHLCNIEPQRLYDNVVAIKNLAGPNFHGVQLNTSKLFHNHIQRLVEGKICQRIILVVNSEVVKKYDGVMDKVASFVKSYEGLVTDVLFDRSKGRATFITISEAVDFTRALCKANVNDLNLVIAGGLDAEALQDSSVVDYMKNHPHTSIDAEGKLLKHGGDYGLDYTRSFLYARGGFALAKFVNP